jgi:hypothetical protein
MKNCFLNVLKHIVVIPVKTGIKSLFKKMDSGLRTAAMADRYIQAVLRVKLIAES